ncbi:MAG: 50S ribosomal protein L18 [Spirochaetota bacterium]|nr:50S ribosomal protein L18 [Spirochaetota bacterium]
MVIDKYKKRERKKKAIRGKIMGTTARPRLTVFKSSTNIYSQLIDDEKQITICAASTLEKSDKKKKKAMCNIEGAKQIGKLLAKRAKEKNIKAVVFDRNGYKYHGRIKALADACREEGLDF